LESPLTLRLGSVFFRTLPQSPGVYFFYDGEGQLLYIGQSSDLRARTGSYRHVTPEKHPKRTLRLVSRVALIDVETCGSAAEAVELERILLLAHRPPFNRAGVWQGDPWWLWVDTLDGKLHLDLNQLKKWIGPLPPAFRYVFGTLVRCVYRIAFPSLAIARYPHGLFDAAVPCTLALALPDVAESARMITAYAGNNAAQLLATIQTLSPAPDLEEEYWMEEFDGLKQYAQKNHQAPRIITDTPETSHRWDQCLFQYPLVDEVSV
jgi:hypothetical protein